MNRIDTSKFSIYLRGFQEDDYKVINFWRNDPEIQKLVSTSFKYVSEAIEKEWVKQKMMDNRKDIYLAICLKKNDRMIGYLSINGIDYINRSATAGGIVIDKEFQDGIIKYEAGVLSRELVFDHLNLNRLTAHCLTSNITSSLIMEATGYVKEGKKRQSIYKDGEYHDQFIYSLIREDYYKFKSIGYYLFKNYIKRIKSLRKLNLD